MSEGRLFTPQEMVDRIMAVSSATKLDQYWREVVNVLESCDPEDMAWAIAALAQADDE